MSLDIYLSAPSQCPSCSYELSKESITVYNANITHNLGRMANEAGIYEALWRPEEIGITKASQLISLLTDGLKLLKADPTYYSGFDAPNGWGTYENFVPWVERYLEACINNPEADISVSR